MADDDDDDMDMAAPAPFAFNQSAGADDTAVMHDIAQGLEMVAQPNKVNKVRQLDAMLRCRLTRPGAATIDPHQLRSPSQTRQRQTAQVQHVEGTHWGGACKQSIIGSYRSGS